MIQHCIGSAWLTQIHLLKRSKLRIAHDGNSLYTVSICPSTYLTTYLPTKLTIYGLPISLSIHQSKYLSLLAFFPCPLQNPISLKNQLFSSAMCLSSHISLMHPYSFYFPHYAFEKHQLSPRHACEM